MNSEWDPPPYSAMFRDKAAWDEYRAREQKWIEENRELSLDWASALTEDAEWRRSRARLRSLECALSRIPEELRERGVPSRCIQVVLDGVKETPLVSAVRKFVTSEATFCLLLGGAGTGKSVAGVVVLYEMARDAAESNPDWPSFRGLFLRAADLARMGAYGDENHERLTRYFSTPFLVLDDLGAERQSDTWLAILDELIDRRYGEGLSTVITSNLDAAAFKSRYGERITDRIRHDGQIIGAGTESLRRPTP